MNYTNTEKDGKMLTQEKPTKTLGNWAISNEQS